MAVPVTRQFRGHLGSEKHQMLDLNKRLETYLSRVKLLEEENELLKEEIQALKGSRNTQAWKGELEGQLRKARGEVEAAWMERDRVELEVGNLSEDLQALQFQRQKEAATQAEARKRMVESKKELEEERRAQIWLREKVAQLEKELQLQLDIHQEEVSHLQARLSHARPVFMAPPQTQVLDLQDLGHQYSQRATRAWQEAAATYQDQVKRLEDSLSQARDHTAQVTQEKRESSLMVQHLAKELDGAQNKKKLLEEKVSQQRNRDLKELELLQAHLESLEGEKANMRDQISDILDDRHNLMQLKMSLGLEVATYRALLDNESLRVDKPSINDPWGSFTVDGGSSHRGVKQKLQTTQNGSHITTPISINLGKRTQDIAVATAMRPVQISQQDAFKPKSAGFTEERGGWSVESSQHAVQSTPCPEGVLNGNGSIEHFREKEVQEEVSHDAALSATRSLEVDAAGAPVENCSIDQFAAGGSDVSMDQMGEKEEHSLNAEPEKHTGLNGAEPNVELQSTACHSTVFSADVPSQFHPEIPAPGSSNVTLNLSEPEPHQSSKDCEDAVVPAGGAIESEHAPLYVWGEKEEVREETERAVAKASEFELGSGSDIKDMDYAFDSTNDYSNLGDFNKYVQAAEKCDSIMSLKATMLSEEVLSHEGKTKEGLVNENENKIKDKCNGDDLPDGSEPAEQVEDELESEKARLDTWDGGNVSETKTDSTDNNEELGHDNESVQGEMREGMDDMMNEVMESSPMEENRLDLDTEIAVVSADGDPVLQIDVNPGDIQQEQTSSDAEQLDFSEEENASHSWRTEGGELESNGSYSLENTLADTRPLIRYKSDEADMNTQASQLGDSDLSEDEGNDDKGCWGEDRRRVITSKSIDFMEDLDEEPERDAAKEEAAGELFQGEEMDASSCPTGEEIIFTDDEESEKVVEEGVALQDETNHVAGPTDFMTDPMENSSEEENGGHRHVVQERDSLSLYSNDDLKGETVDNEAALGLQTEYRDNKLEETETLKPLDSVNSGREVSSQSHSDTEEEVIRSHTESLAAAFLSPPSVLQELCEQPPFSRTVEITPTQNTNSVEGPGEGAHAEETEVLTDRREEGQNMSMLTNVDFTDELSLHSEFSSTMGSIVNTANSDLDEYSSEDDSPNASQSLQPIKQEEVPVNQEESVARLSTSNLSEGLGESARHSSEVSHPRPENVAEEVTDERTEWDAVLQDQRESPSAKLWGHESLIQSVENVAECSQMFLHNEGEVGIDCIAEEKLRVASQPSGGSPNITSDEEDGIFKVKETEALHQTNGKCHDLHNLRSTTLHEHDWSSSKKMEAAYNPQEKLAFGVSWGDMENLLGTSEHTEGNMKMSQVPSLTEQKQIPVQVNQLSGGKMEEDGNHSEDSLDEGDSWSSGEE
ncbi:nestin isoform X1 [Anguilla anguilla]|uniref:nestin isoform X1 n=1 Tax=Anguilla anguilla TaxID=7936 RepID=UPI0015AFB3AF|nr:nestin isoform X1 [Anguilla anguilla]